ncbi:uncharacterized protein DUF2345 [Paraburkholderia caballeronis]|nr:uncharacterized protein DUF2345 [Paraburkholderia caballeronis]
MVIQAQRGAAQLAAQEGVTVESVNGVVHVKSPKEIVLGVGGSYIRITPDGIEMGTRGGITHRTSRLSKTGPAQMDLGGQAFAPVLVPFTTDCEVWRTKSNFTEEIAAAPEPAEWESFANTDAVAAAPVDETVAGTQTATGLAASAAPASTAENDSPSFFGRISDLLDTSPIKIKDKENAPKKKTGLKNYPTPVKLENAVPCNWQMANFERGDDDLRGETKVYRKYGLSGDLDVQEGECSGLLKSKCKYIYDAGKKILTAKVVIAFVPRVLVQVDPKTSQPLLDNDGNYITVRYETYKNGANSKKTFESQNLRMIDRDPGGANVSGFKREIEGTLNKGNYKLILNGCQKGAACGCRVSVKFCVDIHVATQNDAERLGASKIINLFPETARADSGNWPEAEYEIDVDGKRVPTANQVKAHEAGHLFVFPDEYWKGGGSAHEDYIKNDGTLNFELGSKNANEKSREMWQLYSDGNLMGQAALRETAAIQPYYVEYIRRWFSEYTNKEWSVGYEAG